MKVSFLGDVNLDERIVSGVLRAEPSVDFRTAAEAELHGLPDPEVLEIAADEGRLLVTLTGHRSLATLPKLPKSPAKSAASSTSVY